MEYVYHYTSADGLKGILENNSLWATNAEYLNDFKEIQEGINKVNELKDTLYSYSQSIIEKLHAKKQNISLEAVKEVMQKEGVHLVNHYLNLFWDMFEKNKMNEIYTTSFTTARDKLTHWLTYGSEQTSYCIKFNKDKLFDDLYFRRRKLLSGYDIVDYHPTEELLNSLFEEDYLPEMFQVLSNKALDNNERDKKCTIVALETLINVTFRVASIKSKAFEHEDEFRFTCFQPAIVKFNNFPESKYFDFINSSGIDFVSLKESEESFFPLKYRVLKTGIIAPYRVIPFPDDAIEEIIVGPTDNMNIAIKGLESLLSSTNKSIKVSPTNTSFRKI